MKLNQSSLQVKAFLVASMIFFGSSAAQASITLFTDDFSDGDRSNPNWYAGMAGGEDPFQVVNSASFTSGKAFSNVSGNSPNVSMVTAFTPVTLSNANDSITFQINARRGNISNTAGSLQINLGSDGGTPYTQDYLANYGPYGDDRMISMTLDNSVYFQDTNVHAVSFSLTRRTDGDYDRLVLYDGATALSDVASSSLNSTYLFNQSYLNWQWQISSNSNEISDVSITATVPEPSCVLLISLFGIALVSVRRLNRSALKTMIFRS